MLIISSSFYQQIMTGLPQCPSMTPYTEDEERGGMVVFLKDSHLENL